MSWTVAALYRFLKLDDLPGLQAQLREVCGFYGIVGTLLIAPEGINGTIAGEDGRLNDMIEFLDSRLGIRSGEVKFSQSEEKPFLKLKIRIKQEIITMRAPEADPSVKVGTYVMPDQWNALLDDPETVLLDTRNRYETAVGTFKGAIDPQIDVFTEFKDYVDRNLDPQKHRKIAMFCTGGIRCEKASSYMLSKGFSHVYHLKGGILKYLETVPAQDSLWQGECYVFDRRVAVGQDLKEGDWRFCFGCGHPLAQEECSGDAYEEGVSCRHCIAHLNAVRAASLRTRHAHMTGEGERSR